MQAATAAGLRVPERGSQTSAPDTPLGEELSTNGMAALRPVSRSRQAFERPRSRSGASAGVLTKTYGLSGRIGSRSVSGGANRGGLRRKSQGAPPMAASDAIVFHVIT